MTDHEFALALPQGPQHSFHRAMAIATRERMQARRLAYGETLATDEEIIALTLRRCYP